MKTRITALIVLLATAVACTTTPAPTVQTGDDAEVTYDGLHRVDDTIMDSVWARPDIDLKGVTKVIFVPIGISYREVEPSDASTAPRCARRCSRRWTRFLPTNVRSWSCGTSTG